MRIRPIIKSVTGIALKGSGLLSFVVNKVWVNKALILAYHRINSRAYIKENSVKMPMYVSDSTFDLHMQWLKLHYRIVPLQDIVTLIKNNTEWNEPLCAITFDDGWYDNYEHAYPILKKYDIPATIFIVGNNIGESEPKVWDVCFEIMHNKDELPHGLTGISKIDEVFTSKKGDRTEKARTVVNIIRTLKPEDIDEIYRKLKRYYDDRIDNSSIINGKYRKLSWDEIREMQTNNIDFGYHSANHYMLPKVSVNKLEAEIVMPKETAIQNGVTLTNIFSYPDGKFSNDVIRCLKAAGYMGATTLITGANSFSDDPYKLKRVNVHEGSSGTLPHFLYLLASSQLK